jgi:hypothetical protein
LSDSTASLATQHRGSWQKGEHAPEIGTQAIRNEILNVSRPVCLIDANGEPALGR